MRFEFEKISPRYLARRAAEEERKNGGRRCTRIVLTRPEWMELLRNQGYPEGSLMPRNYQIARMPTLASPFDANYEPLDMCSIEVVYE